MAINYPVSLDTFSDPTPTSEMSSPSHSGLHTDINSAVEALEAKVGITSSAVTTSHDYKIAQLETNAILKTLVDAKGDIVAASADNTVIRVAVGTNGQVLTADSSASGGVSWTTVSASAAVDDDQNILAVQVFS